MATTKEITTLCKNGAIEQAYQIAKSDYDINPLNPWSQRALGWAIYYKLKEDSNKLDYPSFYSSLKELTSLNLLTPSTDSFIFDSVLWSIGAILKSTPNENCQVPEIIFSIINTYSFNPSIPYSYILKLFIKFANWNKLVDFLEWWNIEKLTTEDFTPFVMDDGNKVMTLAEQTFIAYSKALLKLNNKEKIREFLPKIEYLHNNYPEMTYLGFYCGKLMIALGSKREETLNILMPFIRKKRNDFWVWDLLSDLYNDDFHTQLSCLLRATHCKTQEKFLGKIRSKLIYLYNSVQDFPRAKYQFDKVIECYQQNNWRLPLHIQQWTNVEWAKTTQPDSSDPIDYRQYTNPILLNGTNESIGVVSFVNKEKKTALIIYDKEKYTFISPSKFRLKVKEGNLLKINYLEENNRINIVSARVVKNIDLNSQSHIRRFEGKVIKRENQSFAFIKEQETNCFIKPETVNQYNLTNNESVSVLAFWNYNKKKDSWNWVCFSLNRNNQNI
jgi:hypothetical protein